MIWGDGNIDEAPLFLNPDEANFHLSADSPCIDSADPESDLDPDGTRADMGAFYFHQRDIEIEPELIEFIGIQTGTTDSLALTIRNTGGTPLQILSQQIISEDTSFTIRAGDEEYELPPDRSHSLWITFSPEEQAEYQAVLQIESDDPDEEVVEIQLIGTALNVDFTNEIPPLKYEIINIYPNPFNSTVTIFYTLPAPDVIRITLFDISGRCIKTIAEMEASAGCYKAVLQADGLPSGIYFVRLMGKNKIQQRKVLLMR